ncbi:MAG: hypothetical protein Q8L29_03260 [archaeon]|nr:hypothetical protein [archaeon]
MGKNNSRDSLIRIIANVAVHEIVAKHTNKPESVSFLNSEIIEYRSKAEKASEEYNWNAEDKEYAKNKALKISKDKLNIKYSDVKYSEEEMIKKLKNLIEEVM